MIEESISHDRRSRAHGTASDNDGALHVKWEERPFQHAGDKRRLVDVTAEELLFGQAPAVLLPRVSHASFHEIWRGEVTALRSAAAGACTSFCIQSCSSIGVGDHLRHSPLPFPFHRGAGPSSQCAGTRLFDCAHDLCSQLVRGSHTCSVSMHELHSASSAGIGQKAKTALRAAHQLNFICRVPVSHLSDRSSTGISCAVQPYVDPIARCLLVWWLADGLPNSRINVPAEVRDSSGSASCRRPCHDAGAGQCLSVPWSGGPVLVAAVIPAQVFPQHSTPCVFAYIDQRTCGPKPAFWSRV